MSALASATAAEEETFGIYLSVGDDDGLRDLLASAPPPSKKYVELIVKQDMTTEFHDSPLSASAREKQPKVLQVLLEHLRDHDSLCLVNSTIKDGRTALMVATAVGHGDCVAILLESGANVNQGKKSDGATPLYMSSYAGNLSVVDRLIEAGADVNQTCTDDGATPLYIASQNGHLPVVDRLLKVGADVNQACTDFGATPLLIASQAGHLSVVDRLLEGGSDVNQACTDDGASPIQLAAKHGHLLIVQSLVACGASVNEADFSGWTPLLLACYSGHDLVADFLIGQAARADAVVYGKDCMEWARENGHDKCVEVLQASIERAKLL